MNGLNELIVALLQPNGFVPFAQCLVLTRRPISLLQHLGGRGYGATVARLTPDQTVGRSNRSGVTFDLLPLLYTVYTDLPACLYPLMALWRNGSASDSRSEGWEFESLWPHSCAHSVRLPEGRN